LQPDFKKILNQPTAAVKKPSVETRELSEETAALKEQVDAGAEGLTANDSSLDALGPLSLRRNTAAEDIPKVAIGRVAFTEEQTVKLLSSPHVNRVTPKTISYTKAFKEEFVKRYCAGESPIEIFASCGLDPDIIGRKRIYGFSQTLRVLVSAGKPLQEGKPPKGQDALPIPKRRAHQSVAEVFASLSAEDVHKLYQRVVYLTQEMEFLKKIMLLDREGK
jgi:hypothetical protein